MLIAEVQEMYWRTQWRRPNIYIRYFSLCNISVECQATTRPRLGTEARLWPPVPPSRLRFSRGERHIITSLQQLIPSCSRWSTLIEGYASPSTSMNQCAPPCERTLLLDPSPWPMLKRSILSWNPAEPARSAIGRRQNVTCADPSADSAYAPGIRAPSLLSGRSQPPASLS